MRKIIFSCLILLCWSAKAQTDVIHNHENPVDRKDPLKSQNYVDPKAHLLELIVGADLPNTSPSTKLTKEKIKRLNEQRQKAFEKLVAESLLNKMDLLVYCEICKGSGDEVCERCKGNRYSDCGLCDGKGDRNCLNCRGSGVIRDVLLCPTCNGKGRTACSSCYGAGKKLCVHCAGIGKGNCAYCNGAGVKLIEQMDSTKNQPHRE